MLPHGRALTPGETALAALMFGDSVEYARVRVHNRAWWPLQPKRITMAPDGHLWFHPNGGLYCADFCDAEIGRQALFIHEMTHVWQAQTRGRWYLPLMRHPFCRYHYVLRPGWPLERYGIEQQAEIVKHAFLLRRGVAVRGAPPLAQYESVLPF